MTFSFLLAAIDVDDTLLGPDKRISAGNRQAVRDLAARGCRIILASGRRHENMARLYAELALDDFAVSCQGARVEHVRTGEVVHSAAVSAADTRAVVSRASERGFTPVVWQSQGIFAPARTEWVERYASETGGEPIAGTGWSASSGDAGGAAAQASQPAEKIVWLGEPAALAAAIPAARREFGGRLVLTQAHDWCLEFADPASSKVKATATLAAHLGVARVHVLAFGDGYNDVGLLRWAGLGVAMPHGRASAREAAGRVGPDGETGTALARAVAELFGEFS